MRFPLQEPVKICWKISWTLRIQWNSRDLRHLLVGALFHWIYLSPLELPDVLHTCWCSRDLMVICAFQKQCKSALGWPMVLITLNPSKVRDETSNETSNDSNDKWQKAKSIALIESPIATVEKDLCQKKGAPWHTFCVKPELCHVEEKFSFGHPESWNLVNASNHFYCLDQQLVPALQAYRIMELEPKCTDMLSTHAKALGQRAIVATCGYAKKKSVDSQPCLFQLLRGEFWQ